MPEDDIIYIQRLFDSLTTPNVEESSGQRKTSCGVSKGPNVAHSISGRASGLPRLVKKFKDTKDFTATMAVFLGSTPMIVADDGNRCFSWMPLDEVAGDDPPTSPFVAHRFPELACLAETSSHMWRQMRRSDSQPKPRSKWRGYRWMSPAYASWHRSRKNVIKQMRIFAKIRNTARRLRSSRCGNGRDGPNDPTMLFRLWRERRLRNSAPGLPAIGSPANLVLIHPNSTELGDGTG